MSTELLPCPFCGGRNCEERTNGAGGTKASHWVECLDCGAAGPQFIEQDNGVLAWPAWNTRKEAAKQPVTGEPERLTGCALTGQVEVANSEHPDAHELTKSQAAYSAALSEQPEKVCEWVAHKDGHWRRSCGCFNRNMALFHGGRCGGCGGKIVEKEGE